MTVFCYDCLKGKYYESERIRIRFFAELSKKS